MELLSSHVTVFRVRRLRLAVPLEVLTIRRTAHVGAQMVCTHRTIVRRLTVVVMGGRAAALETGSERTMLASLTITVSDVCQRLRTKYPPTCVIMDGYGHRNTWCPQFEERRRPVERPHITWFGIVCLCIEWVPLPLQAAAPPPLQAAANTGWLKHIPYHMMCGHWPTTTQPNGHRPQGARTVRAHWAGHWPAV